MDDHRHGEIEKELLRNTGIEHEVRISAERAPKASGKSRNANQCSREDPKERQSLPNKEKSKDDRKGPNGHVRGDPPKSDKVEENEGKPKKTGEEREKEKDVRKCSKELVEDPHARIRWHRGPSDPSRERRKILRKSRTPTRKRSLGTRRKSPKKSRRHSWKKGAP